MEKEKNNEGVVNHFEKDSNCQVFNGDITGCVFAMPGSQVTQQTVQPQADNDTEQPAREQASLAKADAQKRDEALFRYIHYTVDSEHEWQIHDEVKRLVTRQGIQMICQCLKQMNDEKKLLLPPNNPTDVYAELVRMGMPQGKGFNEVTFRKYYMTNG